MLSTLPKLADKAFVIGFLIPSVLFFAAVVFLFSDTRWAGSLLDGFHDKGNLRTLVYAVIAVAGLAFLTLLFNQLFYRIIEGYEWPVSKMSRAREMRRFRSDQDQLDSLGEEWNRLGDSFPAEKRRKYSALEREIVSKFPSKPHLILPTRFGNAIRAFEVYSKDVYGADAIPLWIHLNTVIPKDYRIVVEEARASVSFFLNLLFFSLIVFALAIGRAVASLATDLTGPSAWARISSCETLSFLPIAAIALIICWLSYKTAIYQVYAWGQLVKAAFDCFLPDLAKKLGYELPSSGSEQYRFWQIVSRRAIYHRAFDPTEWVRASRRPENPPEDDQEDHEKAKSPDGSRLGNNNDKSGHQSRATEAGGHSAVTDEDRSAEQ
jgi:hypothetical protein